MLVCVTNRQRSQDFSCASIPIVVIQYIVCIAGDLLFGHEEGNISRIPALFHCHRSAHFHSVHTGLYCLQVARPSYTIFQHNRGESQTSPQPVNTNYVNTNSMSMHVNKIFLQFVSFFYPKGLGIVAGCPLVEHTSRADHEAL